MIGEDVHQIIFFLTVIAWLEGGGGRPTQLICISDDMSTYKYRTLQVFTQPGLTERVTHSVKVVN